MQARRPGEIRSAYVGVDHGTLYYEECGEGQPVILVHGHSLDHRMWDGQFADLARDYRVIRYDLRGYGLSSPQTEDFQFTRSLGPGDMRTFPLAKKADNIRSGNHPNMSAPI